MTRIVATPVLYLDTATGETRAACRVTVTSEEFPGGRTEDYPTISAGLRAAADFLLTPSRERRMVCS